MDSKNFENKASFSKHRVLYLVSTLERCGPSFQLLNIVRGLDPRVFEPLILSLSPEKSDSLWNEFVSEGFRCACLSLNRLNFLWRAPRTVQDYVRKENVSIVHSQGVRADWVSSRLRQVHRISSLRNFPQLDYSMAYGGLVGGLASRLHFWILSKIDSVVCVSRSVEENLLKFSKQNATQVIFNGTDTQRFFPARFDEKERLRSDLGLEPHWHRVWVSAGILSSRKDPESLVRGFVASGRPEDLLIILGDGELYPRIHELSASIPNIRLLGSQADVSRYLRAADGFISSSWAEGFPNSVLEALACGLPCILSDIPPHREFESAGFMLKYFPPGQIDALADQIKRFDFDSFKAEELAARIQKDYSQQSVSAQYQNIYAEALNSPSKLIL